MYNRGDGLVLGMLVPTLHLFYDISDNPESHFASFSSRDNNDDQSSSKIMSNSSSISNPKQIREMQGGVALPPSLEKIESKFDLSIALALSTWSALTLAVQNSWGGPDSSEKRDWFAGAISDLISSTPDADVEYIEEFMLQIMNDEFDINVDDGSAEEIAAKIVGLRKLTLQGDFTMVDEMYSNWQERQNNGGGGGKLNIKYVTRDDNEDDTEWDSDDVEDEDGSNDIEMGEAPDLVKAPKEKIKPRVDEEGFTEVVGRKRR